MPSPRAKTRTGARPVRSSAWPGGMVTSGISRPRYCTTGPPAAISTAARSISSSRATASSGTALTFSGPARKSSKLMRRSPARGVADAVATGATPSPPFAAAMPAGSRIMIGLPSPRMVLPAKMPMPRSSGATGLTTISSTSSTVSTTMPKLRPATSVTTTSALSAMPSSPSRRKWRSDTSGRSCPRSRISGVRLSHSIRCSEPGPARTSSTTDACGSAKRSPPHSTMSAETMARVSGSTMVKVVPCPRHARDRAGAAQPLEIGAHDIEPDAAAGDRGDRLRRREAGAEDEIVDIRLGERGERRLVGEAQRKRPRLDPVEGEAAAVVRQLDDDVAALVEGVEADAPGGRLAQAFAVRRAPRCRDRRRSAPYASADRGSAPAPGGRARSRRRADRARCSCRDRARGRAACAAAWSRRRRSAACASSSRFPAARSSLATGAEAARRRRSSGRRAGAGGAGCASAPARSPWSSANRAAPPRRGCCRRGSSESRPSGAGARGNGSTRGAAFGAAAVPSAPR